MSRRFTEAEITEVWERRRAGEPTRSIARRLGRNGSSIRRLFEDAGGVRPAPRTRSLRHLSLLEREEISRGVARGESLRAIANRLGRAASTVSREVARNDGRLRYRAHRGDRAAWQRARRPQRCKLVANQPLRAVVEEKLALRWSPEQIAGWLRQTYSRDEGMQVSHETIYLTLFIQARGGLKRELAQHLRTRRANRRPQGKKESSGKGRIVDPVMISERPAEVEDRAVPGHWEGDLLMGKRQTAIGTLVERWSRYVMLFGLPNGHSADAVRVALAETVQQLPEHLWQSLTWDQGKEMAQHAQPRGRETSSLAAKLETADLGPARVARVSSNSNGRGGASTPCRERWEAIQAGPPVRHTQAANRGPSADGLDKTLNRMRGSDQPFCHRLNAPFGRVILVGVFTPRKGTDSMGEAEGCVLGGRRYRTGSTPTTNLVVR